MGRRRQFTIRLSDVLADQLASVAAQHGVSVNSFIETGLTRLVVSPDAAPIEKSEALLLEAAENKLHTTHDVANLFSVSAETVRNWIEWGRLDAVKIGRHWRVPRSAVLRLINDRYGDQPDGFELWPS